MCPDLSLIYITLHSTISAILFNYSVFMQIYFSTAVSKLVRVTVSTAVCTLHT